MRHLIISALMLMTIVCSHAANDPVIVDGVVYEWYENSSAHEYGYVAAGWDEETPIQTLHIVGDINGYDVYGIADGAFQDRTNILYLKIDEGISWIGESAFWGCKSLEQAVLPEGLVTIGERAFANCEGLQQFVIPSTVRDIQAHAFMGCTGVTDVYFLMTTAAELDNFVWWDGWYKDYEATDSHGGIEFNRSRKPYDGDDPDIEHDPENGTLVHVPAGTSSLYAEKLEAWLYNEYGDIHPLWWIVNYGVVGRTYTVYDDLTAIYVDRNGDLYAKDAGHWLLPDKAYPGEIDYMKGIYLMNNRDYDQSNWVILRDTNLPKGCYTLAGGTITGTLLDKRNPVIAVTSELRQGDATTYTPNVYIPAAVMPRTQVGSDGNTYAFVRPKPQEYARYDWTIYCQNDELNDEFYVPAPDPDNGINQASLCGGFGVDYSLYEDETPPEQRDLIEGACYPFTAITRLKAQQTELLGSRPRRAVGEPEWQPYADGGLSPWYDVYPLSIPIDDPVITSITQVEGNLQSTIYYDLMGHPSPTPHSGVNIVVTRQGNRQSTTFKFLKF